jgi:integrase
VSLLLVGRNRLRIELQGYLRGCVPKLRLSNFDDNADWQKSNLRLSDTMALLDAVTALRASELIALKWKNVGWDTGILQSQFAFVDGDLKETKAGTTPSSFRVRSWI